MESRGRRGRPVSRCVSGLMTRRVSGLGSGGNVVRVFEIRVMMFVVNIFHRSINNLMSDG